MDRTIRNKLNLNPRSDAELHSALKSFEIKWEHKARNATDDRISRF